ncbi:MAG: SUF system Fe-S cluster assembly protein [Chromatiales bacterium]|nr:SUF system Fe-S cluster assembly protein [Chromatiales bacterium]
MLSSPEPDPSSDPIRAGIVEALREVYDPEIPVNVYDLGLIYDVRLETDGTVEIDMTLTAAGCPVAHTFPGTVEDAVREVEGVSEAHVELVWDPPWGQERISDEAKLELGLL